MNFSKLFSKNNADSPVAHIQQPGSFAPNASPSQNANIDNKQSGETYVNYGKRLCFNTHGAHMSLAACLQRIFTSEKQAMINNIAMQEAHKASVKAEANSIDSYIQAIKGKNQLLDNQLLESNRKITECESEIAVLKANEGEVNKQAKVKFWIGASILVILTVYLFIFYSSTFYSAFIHTPESVSDAMFNPQAIPNAFAQGVMSGLFLCTVPIIFLGLGFGLHYISEQKGAGKYIKGGTLILVTLMFDGILAVAIAKNMYNIWAAEQWGTVPPFIMSMAASDLNVWAVIFCGFIVYMIWAVVFDLTITAYGDLRSNESKIVRQRQILDTERNNAQSIKNEIVKNNGEIQTKEVEKNNILSQLSKVAIDQNVIFNAFTEFYQGWISVLNAVQLSNNQDAECAKTYAAECRNLLGIDIKNFNPNQSISVSTTPITQP